MNNIEYIDKIIHGLTTIKELSESNKYLSYCLKKEMNQRMQLQTEVNNLKNQLKKLDTKQKE